MPNAETSRRYRHYLNPGYTLHRNVVDRYKNVYEGSQRMQNSINSFHQQFTRLQTNGRVPGNRNTSPQEFMDQIEQIWQRKYRKRMLSAERNLRYSQRVRAEHDAYLSS